MLRKLTFGIVFLILVFLVPFSCSIEKRVHQKGFHIAKTSNYVSKNSKETREIKSLRKINENERASLSIKPIKTKCDKKDIIINKNTKKNLSNKSKDKRKFNGGCDVIVFKDGTEIEAKLEEVDGDRIKYRRCDGGETYGPLIIEKTSKIIIVNYPNGKKWIPKEEESNQDEREKDNQSENKSNRESDKDIAIAILLWFFFGLLGIHRFYLGHHGMGVLYLLTGALCGIGWIIDGILFLVGGLKPRA